MDSWVLHKIQQHEELILFLSGNAIPSNAMHDMTYEQALSYFSKLKRFLRPDLLDTLDVLQMASILGIVAGIFQSFSSIGALMWVSCRCGLTPDRGIWVDIKLSNFRVKLYLTFNSQKGVTVDIFWLVMNLISSVFLSVAVCYIAIYMIRDVPYHQVLLTVTAVNLFITIHIWTVNLIALIYTKYFEEMESDNSSVENIQTASQSRRNSESSPQTPATQPNTQSTNNGTAATAVTPTH